jgi:hypothetical protein
MGLRVSGVNPERGAAQSANPRFARMALRRTSVPIARMPRARFPHAYRRDGRHPLGPRGVLAPFVKERANRLERFAGAGHLHRYRPGAADPRESHGQRSDHSLAVSWRGCAEGHPDGFSGGVANPGIERRCAGAPCGFGVVHGQRPSRRIAARNAARSLRWARASSRPQRRMRRCFSSWEYSRVTRSAARASRAC